MKKVKGNNNIYGVIMAGGQGERFWPVSCKQRPKQLLNIGGGRTLIQQAVDRIKGLIPYEYIFIITTQQQSGLIAQHLPFLKRSQIIAEPVGRDTAAAIGLMAVIVRRQDPEAIMAVLPADHKINDRRGFLEVLRVAASIAEEKQAIVTIGIKPDRPATGYGYIEVNKILGLPKRGRVNIYSVKRFIEKPDWARAKRFLASGRFFWNSGMFIMKAHLILDRIQEFMPKLYKGLKKIEASMGKSGEGKVIKEVYGRLDKISIDYGVMEKSKDIYLVESIFDWDDVGAWDALSRLYPMDKDGNVILKKAKLIDAENCIVVSDGQHLVTGLGIKDLIIVSHSKAILVCPRHKAQEVKKLVQKLGEDKKFQQYL